MQVRLVIGNDNFRDFVCRANEFEHPRDNNVHHRAGEEGLETLQGSAGSRELSKGNDFQKDRKHLFNTGQARDMTRDRLTRGSHMLAGLNGLETNKRFSIKTSKPRKVDWKINLRGLRPKRAVPPCSSCMCIRLGIPPISARPRGMTEFKSYPIRNRVEAAPCGGDSKGSTYHPQRFDPWKESEGE